MKKLLVAFMMIAMLFASSCVSFKEVFTLEKAPRLINSVVPSAVEIGVSKEPRARAYLLALSNLIKGFTLGEDLTPETLEQVIKAAKIKELETPEALAVANSVVSLYKTYYDSAVTQKIANVENLVPILKALSDAIDKGLGLEN